MRTTISSFGPLRILLALGLLMLSAASAFASVVASKERGSTGVESTVKGLEHICEPSVDALSNDRDVSLLWHRLSTEFADCVNSAGVSSALLPLRFPPCIMKTLTSDAAIAFTLAIFLAVLARQSLLGYRSVKWGRRGSGEGEEREDRPYWALVAAVISLLALAFLGGSAEIFESEFGKNVVPFFGLALLSLFFGGLVVYWARLLLALLPVVVVALASFVLVGDTRLETELVGLLIGVVGGAWLYWWRDCRGEERATDAKKNNTKDAKRKPSTPSTDL